MRRSDMRGSTVRNITRWCATRWVASLREWAPPPLWPMTAREWPTLDIRSGAELEPSIESIIFALTSYPNVHQCPPRSLATSRTFHS